MNGAENLPYETRTLVRKSLAHPARLKLLDVLEACDEASVCDLTEAIGMDMSTVSRHLAQLKHAGIVASDKRRQMVFCRLRVKCLNKLFGCIESAVRGQIDAQLAVLAQTFRSRPFRDLS